MMRIAAILLATLAAVACGDEPAAEAPASASTAAVPSTQVHAPSPAAETGEAALRETIARGMAGYRKGDGYDFTLSDSFQRIWDRALGDGAMDHDPLCNCQDFEPAKFRHRIASLKISGNRAVASLELDLGFDLPEASKARLVFVRSARGWLLDDIGNSSLPSYRSDMARAAPGSYGIGN